MNNYVQEFIDSVESKNTQKVIRYVFKRINANNIEKYSLMQVEQLILGMQPNSIKEITTIIYILSSYAKWLQEQSISKSDNLYQILQSLDKRLLWKKAKPRAKKKFINNKDFKRVIHDIEMYEEYNSLYYTALFQAVYEGIYNDDLSVLKNLRKSDINNSVATLREDSGHVYKIKISERLASDLRQLADINIWERRNRFSVCKVDMRGTYPDSVFKVEFRTTASNGSYRFSYYSKLRKIAQNYLEYSLLPLQLFASGVMYRIKVELEKSGMVLEDAFTKNNRNRTAQLIIEKELIRTNSTIEPANFRELVGSHIDVFK